MATKGYQTYRGRTPLWKKGLVAALVLILLCAGGVLVFQNFLVFDEDGAHLSMPFGRIDLPEVKQPDKEPVTPPSSSSGEPEGSEDGEDGVPDYVIDVPEVVPAELALHGRAFDARALQNEEFSALGEGERPVLAVKPVNSAALYSRADSAGVAMVREKIAGRDAVARISCYADTDKAEDKALAVMSVSGWPWQDPDGNRYLDPFNQEVTAYLTATVTDCADMGFTEIVLDDVHFPTYGRVTRVDYPAGVDTPQNRVQAISAFLDAAAAALEGKSVTLAISLPVELIVNGKDDVAGWDLAEIVTRVDRIYVPVKDQEQADTVRGLLTASYPDVDAECFLVAECSVPVAGGSYVVR